MMPLTALMFALIAADVEGISGAVDKPAEVKSIMAVDRESGKRHPGTVDAATGKFTIAGLSADKMYDLVIDAGSSRLEGVNLKVKRSDFEEEQPLTDEDRVKLKEITTSLSKFEDTFDYLAVEGNIQYAAVLVSKLRTKPWYESKPGEVIWRLELWHYERPDETWVKDQDELAVMLYRERLQRADFDRKSLTLDPTLGGIKPGADVGKIELPTARTGIRLRQAKER